MNIKAILTGWSNFINKSDVVDEVAKERAKICSKCEYCVKSKLLSVIGDDIKMIEGYKCNKCSCPISAKIRQSIEPCPLGKWE